MPEIHRDVTTETDPTATGDALVDVAADTAHFRAFATRGEDDLSASGPWPARSGTPRVGIIAVALVVIAILAIALVALLLR